jgi:hypothetical protein
MNQCIIIKSIGRSGSHIVRKHLIQHGFKDQEYHSCHFQPYDLKLWKQVIRTLIQHDTVVHTHSIYNPKNSKDWICVLVERRSTFDTICSYLIVDKTQAYINYENVNIEPFVVDLDIFYYHYYNILFRQTKLTKAVNSVKWKKIIKLYYEDIINEPLYLDTHLPYIGNYKYKQYPNFQKSPFSHRDYIINYDELVENFKNILTNNY